MKTILFLFIISTFAACSKSSDRINTIPDYIGIYNSSHNDTAYVSQVADNILKIRYAAPGVGAKIVFNSIHLNADMTFTCNEQVDYAYPGGVPAIGIGSFGQNIIQFDIALNG